MPTVDSNKIVARRYIEDFWNGDDPGMIAEIAVVDVIGHPTPGETLQGRDLLVQRHAGLRRIYDDPALRRRGPDRRRRQGAAALGPSQASTLGRSWVPNQPASRSLVGGMNLFQLANGKIVEFWVNADDLGELQQLGAVPTTLIPIIDQPHQSIQFSPPRWQPMKSSSFDRIAGLAAILAALVGLLYSVSFVILQTRCSIRCA